MGVFLLSGGIILPGKQRLFVRSEFCNETLQECLSFKPFTTLIRQHPLSLAEIGGIANNIVTNFLKSDGYNHVKILEDVGMVPVSKATTPPVEIQTACCGEDSSIQISSREGGVGILSAKNIKSSENSQGQELGSAAACKPVSDRECCDPSQSLIRYVESRLSDMKILFDYRPPDFSLSTPSTPREISGSDLLTEKLDLQGNCLGVCSALYEKLKDDETISNLGFKLGIAVVPFMKKHSEFIFNFSTHEKNKMKVNHTYLIFHNPIIKSFLILDPTTSNYMVRKSLFFGTLKDLESDIRRMLENSSRCYKYNGGIFNSGNSDDSLKINCYLYDKEGSLDIVTKCLIDAWYGENVGSIEESH